MGEFGWAHVTGQRAVGVSGSVQLAKTDGTLHGVPELYYRDGSLNLTGSLNVGGEINAERMNFTVVNKTVSNIFASGSTKFGDTSDDLHAFTGSVSIHSGSLELNGSTLNLSGAHPSLLFYSSSVDGITNLDNITDVETATYQYAQNPALVVSGSTVLLGETAIHGTIGGASPIHFAAPIRSIGKDGDQFDIAGGKFTGNLNVRGAVTIDGMQDTDGMRINMGELLMSSEKVGHNLPLIEMENSSTSPLERPQIILTNTLGGVYQQDNIEEYQMGQLVFRGPVNDSPYISVDNASIAAIIDENGVDTKSYFSFKVRSSSPKGYNGTVLEDDKIEEVVAIGYFGANGFINKQNVRQGMALHGNLIPKKIIPVNPNAEPHGTKDFSIGTPDQVWGDIFIGSDREMHFGDFQETCIGYMNASNSLEITGTDVTLSNNLRLSGSNYILFENTSNAAEDSFGFKNDDGILKFKHQGSEWQQIGSQQGTGTGPSGSVQILNNGALSGSSSLLFENNKLSINGDLEVFGSITAEELVVRVTNEVVTEINTNGSTTFGDSLDDTHTFNGKASFNNGVAVNRVSINSDYTMQVTDYIIGVNTNLDNVSITLPDATQTSVGQIFVIKDETGNSESNPIQITVQVGGQLIDGVEVVTLNSNYSAVSIYCDGQNNFLIF
jgi:hypothetical protein